MKSKKIGLLTFHNNTNYGSWLQTYGLYKTVKKMGYEIEVIDFWQDNIPCTEIISLRGLFELWNKMKIASVTLIINTLKIQRSFTYDKAVYMKLSRKRYRRKNIRELNKEYDVFLIGSDLVWDVRYAEDYTYMLDFALASKKKIAYAASYGYNQIPKEERRNFKKYLSRFQTITVREKNSKYELEYILNKEVGHVCDPTMLLGNEEWKKFIVPNKRMDKYVLVYMPDDKSRIVRAANQYAKRHHCNVLFINRTVAEQNICPYDIGEFLSMIYYAEKIFTGSYHGLLFSIYFRKEFAYICRKPSNRLQSIAEVLGIEKYDISNPEYDMNEKIDYTIIKQKEQKFRVKSKKILREMLVNAV